MFLLCVRAATLTCYPDLFPGSYLRTEKDYILNPLSPLPQADFTSLIFYFTFVFACV